MPLAALTLQQPPSLWSCLARRYPQGAQMAQGNLPLVLFFLLGVAVPGHGGN